METEVAEERVAYVFKKAKKVYAVEKELANYLEGKLKKNKSISLNLEGFDIYNHQNEIRININKEQISHLVHKNFDLSCGQRQFTNFCGNEYMDKIAKCFKKEFQETCLIDIYTMLFNFIKRELKCQFIIASNNNLEQRSIMNDLMDKLKRWDTPWLENPNSFRTIKLWIL